MPTWSASSRSRTTVTDLDSALADLVGRLNTAYGADTYDYVDVDAATGETDALGDDAIKVGMLYRKPSAVTPTGATAVLNTDSFVDGASGDPRKPTGARPVLRGGRRCRDVHGRRQPPEVEGLGLQRGR